MLGVDSDGIADYYGARRGSGGRKGMTMKVRIGHLSTFYHTAILLMADGGTEKRLDARIEWRLMGTGPAIVQAFRQGELDLAYIGLPPAIIGIDQGVNIVCVAGGHMEGTAMAGKRQWRGLPEEGDLGVVLSQFRGRVIGVPGRGSIHDVILKDCIEKQGLEREIEVRNFAWADLVTEAVVKDEVSAAVGTPALAAAIRRFADGRVLIPPSKLWPDNPSYGIAVDRNFLEKYPGVVERFLGLHEEATAFIRNQPSEAARAIADFVGIVDQELVLDAIGISPRYCAQLTEAYIASTMKFVPVLRRLGYIRSEIAEDRIFDRGMIDRIHPGKYHYGEGIRL
jgi:NitT/TauT family transport system substrate-binding protein